MSVFQRYSSKMFDGVAASEKKNSFAPKSWPLWVALIKILNYFGSAKKRHESFAELNIHSMILCYETWIYRPGVCKQMPRHKKQFDIYGPDFYVVFATFFHPAGCCLLRRIKALGNTAAIKKYKRVQTLRRKQNVVKESWLRGGR